MSDNVSKAQNITQELIKHFQEECIKSAENGKTEIEFGSDDIMSYSKGDLLGFVYTEITPLVINYIEKVIRIKEYGFNKVEVKRGIDLSYCTTIVIKVDWENN